MLKYASIFINKCCKNTIAELKKSEYRKIKIPNLMPAFMNIKVDKDDKPVGDDMKIALDFIVNHCINKRNERSKTVHNMAFFFHSKINNPKRLLDFLEQEEIKKSKGLPIYFEVDYALNICKQNEKKLEEQLNTDVENQATIKESLRVMKKA